MRGTRSARSASSPRIAVEAGIETTHRELRFPGGGTAPIGYSATLGASPRLRLELRLLAFAREGSLAVFADGTYQPAFDLPTGARTHPATASRLRAGVQARLPIASWLVVLPSAAYARETFEVGRVDGVALPGFANTQLQGASAALALELALGRRLLLLAGVDGTWWPEAGELAGGSRFFPGGTALGAGGEAGVALRLGGALSLRALAVYSTIRWSLDPDPSGAYSVRAARAEAWGGRFSLRTAW